MEPLARVSIATMPKRPLPGASVATHTTGISARDARWIQGRKHLRTAGEGDDPVHLVVDGGRESFFVAFAEAGIGSKLKLNIFEQDRTRPLREFLRAPRPKTKWCLAAC